MADQYAIFGCAYRASTHATEERVLKDYDISYLGKVSDNSASSISWHLEAVFINFVIICLRSELGDYNPDEHNSNYLSNIRLIPNQTEEMERKIAELHKLH
ncbi:hypothetical protein D910_09237, partial [Dendroctonus ponderosae]